MLASFAHLQAAEVVDIPEDVARVLKSRHPKNVDDLRLLEAHVLQIVEQAIPATVGVEVGRSVGSGVIVSAEGLVLTAGHVIGKAGREATIVLPDGRRLSGLTLGASFEIDAGMVKITKPPADLPFVPMVDKQRPEVSQWVVATGQPGGTFDDRSPPIRLGRVLAGEEGWICTDCTLVGGDSGGPLFNMRGEVTAIHTSIGPSVVHNFHVPLAMIQEDWQRLLEGEVWGNEEDDSYVGRPLLGISGREQNNHCLVTRVFLNMPAQVAGIQVGDYILSIGENEVHSFADVAQVISTKRPGQTIRLRLERNGNSFEVEVVLSAVLSPAPDDSTDPE